ncbi:hypothetical protein, partial [Dermacoccus nishinomiyaensis]|uniref:hypothetical protein n=1 Tax=Dermacoccus nishinomiyaensis TaxID=1274 RepID=UPI001C92C329
MGGLLGGEWKLQVGSEGWKVGVWGDGVVRMVMMWVGGTMRWGRMALWRGLGGRRGSFEWGRGVG